MGHDVILETNAISRRFGKLVAVDGVSIQIAAGEIFGLLGANGAGKSTLIKMLTTLLPPSSGSATIAGFDIAHQATSVRRVIGYVPQSVSADGELTAYENLLVFAKLYNMPRHEFETRIRQALDYMQLADVSDRPAKILSGGMLRKLEIAISMLHHPRLLFLDEPTVGLDPIARESVWMHIQKLRSDYGTTILLTTHYMEEAEKLCSRVAIMHRGKIAAIGTSEELKKSVGHYTTTLNQVFTYYAGGAIEDINGQRESERSRRRRR